ncbi:MAG: hypothetical protein JXR30_02540 [Alphaproteobacteria bacterium]|nr:hypothetical protein [Alphaproteobacteria bacterium]
MRLFSVVLFSLFLSSGAFAQTEPNYYDLSNVLESLKSLKNSCPQTNPACDATCSNGMRRAMMMNNGGNVTAQQANALKDFWWKCYNTLMKR